MRVMTAVCQKRTLQISARESVEKNHTGSRRPRFTQKKNRHNHLFLYQIKPHPMVECFTECSSLLTGVKI